MLGDRIKWGNSKENVWALILLEVKKKLSRNNEVNV